MTLSIIPILLVDVGGAILMIVLSFFSVRYALSLRYRDPQNIIWTYLLWSCLALSVFAVSRSAGHIVKQVLIISGHSSAWFTIRPYSGAINSFTFVVVGAVTLFFERTWSIYQDIIRDRQALRGAHQKLVYLNQNLEALVDERTTALTASEQRYRRIFETSKDMILTTAMNGRILDLNPAGFSMLGLDAGALAEEVLLPMFFSDAAHWDKIVADIEKQGFVSNIEVDLKNLGDSHNRVLLSSSRGSGSGNTIHFVVKDIEQQRQMREQMAQADKLASIGELSAGIAHEINNPLGIILGYTQLMLRQKCDDPQRFEDLKTIEKHARNCKTIVEDLLNFARTSQPKKELFDVHVIVDEVLDFVEQHAKLGQIHIDKDYDRKLSPLLLDAKKIKQVFINLIMNARYAVGRQGTITVRTGMNGQADQVRISIEDTGPGIEQKNLTRIFDPFFTTKPTGEGTGLGLSVSYGIVKNHGGEITVESRPGQGATFSILLPVPPSKHGRSS